MARKECAYAEVQDIKDHFGSQWNAEDEFDVLLDNLILRASRLIDEELHWPNCHYAANDPDTDQTRYFDTEGGSEMWIPRCVSITSLALDQDGDGVHEDVWTEDTHFVVWPYDKDSFDKIIVKENVSRSFPTGQKRLEIVGKFGGFLVPPSVIKNACILTAARNFKRGLQGFQDSGVFADLGAMVYTMALDPDVKETLRVVARRITVA